MFAVTLINILDGTLALVAAGQVNINVGPLATFFRKEALKQQLHAHGIHGGDAKAIADSTVGGRAASLRQNPLAAAELRDIPHHQKVAGESQLFNHTQFVLNLATGLFVERPIALPRPALC